MLIATPGRLLDLFERGKILLTLRILVIGKADRMLDMSFIRVERIVGLLPKSRQTLFFSATMPPEIRKLANAFLNTPAEVSVAPPASPAETVAQSIVVVGPDDKRETLRRLIRSEDVKNALIFCNRKKDVDILYKSLTKHGFDAAALHGDMPQPKRTETLDRFKKSEIRLLVCSDVAARGLDIQGLSHVFCFDVPIHAEDYVHRIGRTGRAGREGRSFTLAAPEDGKSVAIQSDRPRHPAGDHPRHRPGARFLRSDGRAAAGRIRPPHGSARPRARRAAPSRRRVGTRQTVSWRGAPAPPQADSARPPAEPQRPRTG